ncbi:guanylate kinase [Aeoliella sp. ICT_H6.2]|uniref:Guanylate kinase n=1 Tax=Aeoliella straminimaris TaxID=2954799 RepID=A0A9X2F808_9BACT|nr:guanylate kinase [Aeoliella straminimaris]MCO6043368.1 guanylate kinase [Aeoliella straminimaris]
MTPAADQQGRLVIISGPSGVGKSTIVAGLIQRLSPKIRLSVSATTREPRPGEVNGRQYHFLSPEEFAARREAGEFLECMEVFGRGHWYGTLFDEVRPSLAAGQWVILEIDVDGARKAREQFPQAVTIFITVESDQELEQRLRSRKTDTEEAILRRLDVARHEMDQANTYKYRVVNDKVESTIDQIANILTQEGLEV